MNRNSILAATLAAIVLLAAAPCPAQRTWIVDEQNGAGTDFTDIPPAVAAAAPGDVIRVRLDDRVAPWYQAPTIDGKGLQILGDPGLPWIEGTWTIRNVPVDQEVVVADVHVGPLPIYQQPRLGYPPGIRGTDNRGPLVFERIRYQFAFNVPPHFICAGDIGILFDRCDLVVMSDSELHSCGWSPSVALPNGLAVLRSNLMMDRCTVHSWPIQLTAHRTTALMVQYQSTVRVSACVLQGHDGPTHTTAGQAITVCGNSEVWVGGGTQLIAGRTAGGRSIPVVGLGFPSCFPVTVVHRDPSTVIVGVWRVDFYIDAPGEVTALEHAVTQSNLHLVQHARPAAPLLLVAAKLTPTPWPVAGVPVWLDPFPAPLTTEFALAPASGQRVRDIPIPPGIPSGTRFAMQSFELLPTGELLTSNVTSMGLW